MILSLLMFLPAFCQNTKVVDIPKATWVKIYFKSIDEAATATNLPILRNIEIPPDDIEIRIWEGFGITPLLGYVIKRQGGKWSASYVEGMVDIDRQKVLFKIHKIKRKTNWGLLWQKLESSGFCNIADDSQIESKVMILDGVGWVVEIAKNEFYRTYLVNNPDARRSPGGDLFLKLIKPISKAFSAVP